MKKSIKILFAFLMIAVMIIPACSLTAFADEEIVTTLTGEDVMYTVKNGKATIIGTARDLVGDVVVPSKIDGFTVVGIEYLFKEHCEYMTSLTIPATVKSLNMSPFYDHYPNLKRINFASFKQFCEMDFVHPELINPFLRWDLYAGGVKFELSGNIVIPEGVEKIGRGAFSGLHSEVKSITVPTTLKQIDKEAFELTTVPRLNVKDLAAWCDVDISAMDSGLACNELYVGGKKVTELVIPDGVTEIKGGTFLCNSITSVTIPESVTKIGQAAFYGCEVLESVEIPGNVKEIGTYAFAACPALTSVTIHDGVTTIGRFAFKGCQELANVVIPDSVTQIGESAFEGCWALTSVKLPSNLIRINDATFADCRGLKSVSIPASVEKIGYRAFSACILLENVEITDGVIKIGEEAFEHCTSLKSITIPGTVKEIDDNAFLNCGSLTTVVLEDGVERINSNAFDSCINLELITIPNSVTKIHNEAFIRCNKLAFLTREDSFAYEFAGDRIKVIPIKNEVVEDVPPTVTEEPDAISPLWYVIPICAVVVIAAVVLIIVVKQKKKA